MKIEEAQRILIEAGIKYRARTVKAVEYVIRCPDKQCQYHTLAGAFRDPQVKKVILNAARHWKARSKRIEKAKQRKAIEKLLTRGDKA